ncbi:MAG: hypothetical protein LUI10_10280 [Lachnospiraceae bacterium]|nr:hypothetical protein [Lachnospiraceae bacterium]
MEDIRIEVESDLYEQVKQMLGSFGISIEDATAKFFEHMVADKERILRDFQSGIPAEELVERAAGETVEILMQNRCKK